MYQEQIKSAESQLTMLEEQISNIEQATIERDIMKVIERGNEVLNNLQKECNIENPKNFWWYEWLKEKQEELIAFSFDDNVEVEMNKVELSSLIIIQFLLMWK